jgi:hypothetical protein
VQESELEQPAAAEPLDSDPATDYAQAPTWWETEVPEFYADTVNVSVSTYGLSITFGVRSLKGPRPTTRIHMSQEMALVASKLLRRVLRTYELDNGITIPLPENVLSVLKLRDSDFEELESRAQTADLPVDEGPIDEQ